MKKFFFVLSILLSLSLIVKDVIAQTSGPTILEPGDIAIIEFNSDNNFFSFVTLVPISPNTEINFSSRGWRLNDGINYVGEEVLTWSNSLNETIPAGSVITSKNNNPDFSSPITLSSTGDQIFIFQGSQANPIMLFGINFNTPGWVPSATGGNDSALPPALDSSNSINAVELIDGIYYEYDNGIYKGQTTGIPENLMAEIVKISNWELSDRSLENKLPISFTISPTVINNPNLMGNSKSTNWYVVYFVFPIIAILWFLFFQSRRNNDTKNY